MTMTIRPNRAAATTAVIALLGGIALGAGWIAASVRIPADHAAADIDTPALSVGPVASNTCTYANTWLAPRSNGRKHQGVDIIAISGTPVLAVTDGTIAKVLFDRPGSLSGNQLNLRWSGGSTYFTYLHLQAFAEGIKLGSEVHAGDVIGYVGKTGSASVPHLHFEVHPRGGSAIDPTPIVGAIESCGRQQSFGQIVVSSQPPSTEASGAEATAPTAQAAPSTADSSATVAPMAEPDASAPQASVAVAEPPSTMPPDIDRPSMVTGKLNSFDTVTFQVAGAPGAPPSITSAELSITVTSDGPGRASLWPCGVQSGFDYGSQITLAGGSTSARLTVSPGADGQVCMTADVPASFQVGVRSFA
jgi:Peptidase family M23